MLPFVQTRIGDYVTEMLNKDFKTDIKVDQVSVSIFGGVKLKNVMIKDHHKDTLIYSNRIQTNVLSFRRLYNGDLLFGDIRLDGLVFNLKTYKGEKDSNLDEFIALFDSGKPSGKKFLMKASNIYLDNGRFILIDQNNRTPNILDFTKLNADLNNFKIYGPDVTIKINKMAFKDSRGLYVENLSSDFTYTKKFIKLDKLDLLTEESFLKGNAILSYDRKDFVDFNNKVLFDIEVTSASVGTNDIYHFYKEIGKNQQFELSASIKGTLNDFYAKKLKLVDKKNSQIIGDVNFRNLFGKKEQHFYMKGNFQKVSSNFENLTALLPNILGKKLPSTLSKLGQFDIKGLVEITTTAIDADFYMVTALGNIKSVLAMTNINNIDNASYIGNIILEDFDIGTLLDRKELSKVSLNIDVDGKGFTEKYLNTNLKGTIYQIDYKNYNYTAIALNGDFKLPIYQGQISVDDPNLKMNFDGLLDLSKKESRYDFHIVVENADLNKIKLVKDSISIFKGDVLVQLSGKTIDNLEGNVFINKTVYQNVKGIYPFDDFTINSSFDENRVRTLTVNSPDIIQGEIVGKYEFGQLEKLMTNSLGSLYANYKPIPVKTGQFLKFNFTIFNKIIEIFYPEISIGSNTIVKGKINSEGEEFKLNFNSPKISVSNYTFDNIRLSIDNKNPLYNAYVEMDTIKNKQYKIRDFSLINITAKDTLFFRTEFKGGKMGEDYFNLNLYHTINAANNNVVGISKSEVKFKDYLWFLNETDTADNQLVFDKKLQNFAIDNIVLSHENQKVNLNGVFRGAKFKDLKLSFTDVDLNKITPETEKFVFNGNINGEVNFKQDDAVFEPTASIVIDRLNLNNTDLGTLDFNIEGDELLRKFAINANIINEKLESFNAKGNLEIVNKETLLDLNLKLDKFNLGVLGSLGGEVLSNIRGFVSGNSTIKGNLKKPEINGRLYVDNAGLTIPYLNVDYALKERTIVDLSDEKFIFRNNSLTDTKYQTKGILNGSIEHNNFSDWKLDLAISSKRFLALDTKDTEDAAYYGTAFIDGTATIKGPTNRLFIRVAAKSEKGTSIKIPINNAESVSDNQFIHFVTAKEKINLEKGIVDNSRNYNGLELEFDFDITPNAEVEVILDRNTGHGMKGKGFGSLLFKINTLGKFNMWGDFQAYEGTYNFKYGGLIDKKFAVRKGGSISWEGNPMKAQLNLEAVYRTTANPAILLDNSSFNAKVPVDVVIGIRGDLASPDPDFNIEFPTVSSVLKSEIQYKLFDKDVRQTQALYLLSSGGFLSPEGINQSDLSASLFETASNLLGGIIPSDDEKLNLGFNYISADRRIGRETDGRFVATISSRINERITINGKVGVPVGGINESAIVGDVEVQYRVNEDGTLNLRFFNRENDINYIGEGIGYTQGLGVSYNVDFDTFNELLKKIFKNQKLERAPVEGTNPESDSAIDPADSSKSKKSNTTVKAQNNLEAVIPEEED